LLPEHDVWFLARGSHLAAMKDSGLAVTSGSSSFTVSPCKATDNPNDIGPVDVVLVCVKAWQVPSVAEALKSSNLLGPDTVVVPLQNGLDSMRVLTEVLGEQRVCGGLCKIFAYIEGPGRVMNPAGEPSVEFGGIGGSKAPGPDHPNLIALKAAFEAAGVKSTLFADTTQAIWQKFVFICVLSAVGCVTRVTWGEIRRSPATWNLVELCVQEAAAVAAAKGVPFKEEWVRERTQFMRDSLPDNLTPSMQRDIMEGRPSELETQLGTMTRLAAEAGVATPTFDLIYGALLPLENRARAN